MLYTRTQIKNSLDTTVINTRIFLVIKINVFVSIPTRNETCANHAPSSKKKRRKHQ